MYFAVQWKYEYLEIRVILFKSSTVDVSRLKGLFFDVNL